MTTPVTTKVCLGHEMHVKKCHSREEVREQSTNVLGEYSKKVEILSSKTYMVEGTEKRKLFGSKKIYDLFITFFHQNNVNACNHFEMRQEAASIETEEAKEFFDAVEVIAAPVDPIEAIRKELQTVLPELVAK